MCMKCIICLILIFFSVFHLFGQTTDSVVVQIRIKDKVEKNPVRNVNVTITDGFKTSYLKTNGAGFTELNCKRGINIDVKLSHNQYISIQKNERVSELTNVDTLFLNYEMEFVKTQELDVVVIAAPGVPVPVFDPSHLHVEDFVIQKNGDILLLTYPKRLKKGNELILFDGFTIKQSFQAPELAQSLISDFRGNSHVVCEKNVYGIHPDGDKIGISVLDKAYYMTYLAPILDTNKTKMYFSNFSKNYPAFDYMWYDQLDSTYRKILNIEDTFMMELYRAEFKWADVRTKLWALNKEIESGVDAEIWVGANYFTQSIYYKELYAPLFHRNDSLFVFDYYKDKLYTYNASGEVLDSTEIYHHYHPRQTGWRKKLIQDPITGQIYALYDRDGFTYLGWVDTKTGEINEQVKLEYRYVEKVEIQNNYVYYIYRPFESIEKKHLFKERLPYDFGNAKMIDSAIISESNDKSGD